MGTNEERIYTKKIRNMKTDNGFHNYSYEELNILVQNLHKLYYSIKPSINVNEKFNEVIPNIKGSMVSQLKYWWIIRKREQKLKGLGL